MTMTPLCDHSFRQISDLMYEVCGLSFSDSKRPLISSRLAPRIQRLGLDGYEAYASLLTSHDDHGELQVAIDLLTTNETYFFREPAHFEVLEQELMTTRPQAYSVWSAASSFGDEAYSLAMLMADLQTRGYMGSQWNIMGSDISDRVLRSATQAIYPEERLRHVSTERLKRYCLRGEGDFSGLVQIKDSLREHVRFGQLNLMHPISGIGPFDAIFLRNVLIYFDPPTKSAVVDRVLGMLRPGGLFFIGTAEGRVPCKTPLQAVRPGAFRKMDA